MGVDKVQLNTVGTNLIDDKASYLYWKGVRKCVKAPSVAIDRRPIITTKRTLPIQVESEIRNMDLNTTRAMSYRWRGGHCDSIYRRSPESGALFFVDRTYEKASCRELREKHPTWGFAGGGIAEWKAQPRGNPWTLLSLGQEGNNTCSE